MKQATKELGRLLPDRIRLLASLIARKPSAYTSEWAKTVDDAFHLYTRTSTINALGATNDSLIVLDWPFPAFIDLENELEGFARGWEILISGQLPKPSIIRDIGLGSVASLALLHHIDDADLARRFCDEAMISLFNQHQAEIFNFWRSSAVLHVKSQIISDIEAAFAASLRAAVITAAVPLLDHIVRVFFGTNRLNVTIQVIRDAFVREAGLRSKDLKPGSAIWDARSDPEKGNTFAQSLEEDLRLPGIYLSSFIEFADRYYQWYQSAGTSAQTPLNRHAIMHCASEYWTEANTVRILVFLDLTLRLDRIIRILVTGTDPGPTVRGA